MPHDELSAETSASPDDDGRWRTSLAVPVVIVFIAVVAIGAIIVLALQEQDRGGDAIVGTSVDAETLPVTVPYRMIAGYPVIDVTLGDGGRTVPMVLDTGAPTVVTESVADVFSTGTVGTVAATSAAGEVITSDVVLLPQLAIGDAVFHDVGAVLGAIEAGNPLSCLTDSGFVGSNLMRRAVWQLDPVAGTVTIAATVDQLEHTDETNRLAFSAVSELSPSPLVQLPAGDGALAFLLDTGSDGWLAVNPLDLEGLGLEEPADVPTEAVLVSSGRAPQPTREAWLGVESTIAETARTLPLATTELLPPGRGIAGTDFLSRFITTIDWTEGFLYLEPITELTPTIPTSVTLGWDDGYVIGAYVVGRSGTEGLELGAEVIAIDGVDVRGVPYDDFCTRLTSTGTPFPRELTVAGEGDTTIEVTAAEGFFEAVQE